MRSKTTTLALLLAAAITILTGSFATQSKAKAGGASAPEIEGSWIETVTDPISGSSFTTLSTYTRGGAFVTAAPPLPNPLNRSTTGHGTWERTGGHEFVYTFVYFRYNSAQQLLGSGKVRAVITLNEDGDEYEARATLENFNAAGLLTSTGCSVNHARRINVEPPFQMCQ
jgi:hypothetical protein